MEETIQGQLISQTREKSVARLDAIPRKEERMAACKRQHDELNTGSWVLLLL